MTTGPRGGRSHPAESGFELHAGGGGEAVGMDVWDHVGRGAIPSPAAAPRCGRGGAEGAKEQGLGRHMAGEFDGLNLNRDEILELLSACFVSSGGVGQARPSR